MRIRPNSSLRGKHIWLACALQKTERGDGSMAPEGALTVKGALAYLEDHRGAAGPGHGPTDEADHYAHMILMNALPSKDFMDYVDERTRKGWRTQ